MMLPRRMGPTESRRSFRVGMRELILARTICANGFSAFSRISARPNNPMITGTKPIPSMSSIRPKVKRGKPRMGSMPTMARSRPKIPIISALTMDLPARPISRDSPSMIRAKNSTGPNSSAHRVSGPAASTRAIVANVPPMKEPMAAMAQRDPGPPLLGHRVAVQAGDGRGCLPGHVQQDAGDGPPVLRAVEERGEHDDGAGGTHLERQGDEHRRRRPPARFPEARRSPSPAPTPGRRAGDSGGSRRPQSP